MKTLQRSMCMIGLAIIISAFIELRTASGISPYHALIVLNISLINLFAGIVLSIVRGAGRKKLGWNLVWYTAHSTLVGAFGLYFWSKPEAFLAYIPSGEASSCRPMSEFWLFGPVSTTNRQLKKTSLLFYGVIAIPFLGVGITYVILLIFWTLSWCIVLWVFFCLADIVTRRLLKPMFSSVRPILDTPRSTRTAGVSMLTQFSGRIGTFLWFASSFGSALGPKATYILLSSINILPVIFMIISTEEMVKLYSPHVVEPENNWTYGQTLALCNAVFSTVPCMYE
ncbi:hypothetical protein PQX77_020630 [Marasmius sp. AFHP31]|nr:hypothetical protein PQX77_020630 [Marasmius sp. AFHP31]